MRAHPARHASSQRSSRARPSTQTPSFRSDQNDHLNGIERFPDPFRHGVASGDPLADRVILWTRITLQDEPEPEVGVGRRARPGARRRRRVGRDADLRERRLHGPGRRGGARARDDVLLRLHLRRAALAGRPDEDGAGRRGRSHPLRPGLLRQVHGGLLQRLRARGRARRPRLPPPRRRLHLRVRERRPEGQRARDRPGRRPAARVLDARALPPPLRPLPPRPGRPARPRAPPDHRDPRRPRDRRQHLA